MMPGSPSPEASNGLQLYLRMAVPVARALVGLGRHLHHQVADVLKSGPRGRVEAAEVVIYGWHGRNDTRRQRRERQNRAIGMRSAIQWHNRHLLMVGRGFPIELSGLSSLRAVT